MGESDEAGEPSTPNLPCKEEVRCNCNVGFDAAHKCGKCSKNVDGFPDCNRCNKRFDSDSYPLCNIDACTTYGTFSAETDMCECIKGWYAIFTAQDVGLSYDCLLNVR